MAGWRSPEWWDYKGGNDYYNDVDPSFIDQIDAMNRVDPMNPKGFNPNVRPGKQASPWDLVPGSIAQGTGMNIAAETKDMRPTQYRENPDVPPPPPVQGEEYTGSNINRGLLPGVLGGALDEVLGDGVGKGLLTSGLGFLGNTLGTNMIGGLTSKFGDAAMSILDPMQNKALEMQEKSMDNVLERQRSAMINSNAMGQIGQSAALGIKQATDAQRASAQGTYALGQAENSANSLLANARAQAQQNMQLAQKNLGNQRSQSMNMMAMAGGPASAATRSAQAAGQAGNDAMLGMAAQNNQSMQSAFGNAAQIRSAGNQAFIQDKQNQYNSYVAPYLNKWDNNLASVAQAGNAGLSTGLGLQGQAGDTVGQASGYIMDPLEGMTKSIGTEAERDTYRRTYGEGPRYHLGQRNIAPFNQYQNYEGDY